MLSKAALRDGVRDCYGPRRTARAGKIAIADKFNAEKKQNVVSRWRGGGGEFSVVLTEQPQMRRRRWGVASNGK